MSLLWIQIHFADQTHNSPTGIEDIFIPTFLCPVTVFLIPRTQTAPCDGGQTLHACLETQNRSDVLYQPDRNR